MKRKHFTFLSMLCSAVILMISCGSDGKPGGDDDMPDPIPDPDPITVHTKYPQVSASFAMPDNNGGRILDFSRTGYRWGDEALPAVAVQRTIQVVAGETPAQTTARIRTAINEVGAMALSGRFRGAVLIKAGTYEINGELTINKSGVVVRGEGSDPAVPATCTLIKSVGTQTSDINNFTPNVFTMGGSGSRTAKTLTTPNIKDTYVPEGRFWVRVSNATSFSKNDNVVVYRDINNQWLTDLGLSAIWSLSDVNKQYAERVVTRIDGDTLWFENPIPCAIETRYGGGYVYKYTYSNRISDSGIENMAIESQFFSRNNETHCWQGITIGVAEHCWVKNVTGRYFGGGLVYVKDGAKNITVKDCKCTEFQSTLDGSRRYPYLLRGQLCLFMNCSSSDSRHPFATSGSTTVGPNAFVRGSGLQCNADAGPHMRWAQGTLYDCLTIGGALNLRNRLNNGGDKHGWAGTNEVAWNCTSHDAGTIEYHYKTYGFIIQSPQVSGKNYGIGCVGPQVTNTFDTGSNPPSGPGVYISHGTNVTPLSLYDAQLLLRNTNQPGGVFDVK